MWPSTKWVVLFLIWGFCFGVFRKGLPKLLLLLHVWVHLCERSPLYNLSLVINLPPCSLSSFFSSTLCGKMRVEFKNGKIDWIEEIDFVEGSMVMIAEELEENSKLWDAPVPLLMLSSAYSYTLMLVSLYACLYRGGQQMGPLPSSLFALENPLDAFLSRQLGYQQLQLSQTHLQAKLRRKDEEEWVQPPQMWPKSFGQSLTRVLSKPSCTSCQELKKYTKPTTTTTKKPFTFISFKEKHIKIQTEHRIDAMQHFIRNFKRGTTTIPSCENEHTIETNNRQEFGLYVLCNCYFTARSCRVQFPCTLD